MDIFNQFISEYATTIIFSIITALAAALGTWIKRKYDVLINDKTKKAVVETCVKAVEQLYKDLHGQEKFDKCVENISEMLAIKGIDVSTIEMQMLVEAALAEFNGAFNGKKAEAAEAVTVNE